MTEETQTSSIQARIAALNVDHVGRAPITAKPSNWNSQVDERPTLEQRSNSTIAPQTSVSNGSLSNGIGNEPNLPKRNGVLPPPTNITRTGQKATQPPKPASGPPCPPKLPARRPSNQPSPALPPRRPSEQTINRRDSNESLSSTISTTSNLSNGVGKTSDARTASMGGGRVKAPVFDPATLPPLPPKRTKEDIENRYKDIEKSKAFPGYKDAEKRRASLTTTKSSPSVSTVEILPPPTTPALPPRRPTRLDSSGDARKVSEEQPPPKPARSALSYGMNKAQDPPTTNGVHGRAPSPNPPKTSRGPPPVPLASRPDLSKAMATKPRPLTQSQASTAKAPCLICRDFSAPDAHAANFPRQSVPSIDWLATQLTAPFESPTDKARCIFTWLHHNVEYDVVSFFNNTVKPSTPAGVLQSGLAVCEGYAGLFTALATKAGLESVVVGGHGKGFGFTASLAPGAPMPSENSNHAWNAVKIDDGYWKTIDSCWGAGNISGAGQPYNKQFTPKMFTMSNDDFSLRHFPTNRSQAFRSDGRAMSWEEYMLGDTGGDPLQVYTLAETEGIAENSFLPKYKKISVTPSAHQGPTVRFQFSLACEHFDPIRNGAGKPFVFILSIHGIDGRADDFVPFETNGMFWWADVEVRRLGCRGQTVSVYTVDTVNGQSGRGMSVEEYRASKGRKAMGFGGIAMWELI
ncbi:hypothetical protein ACLMJK_000849 [Lecanora helva]